MVRTSAIFSPYSYLQSGDSSQRDEQRRFTIEPGEAEEYVVVVAEQRETNRLVLKWISWISSRIKLAARYSITA